MPSRLWLLVKWIDKQDVVCPSYGVISVNPSMYDASELQPGRIMRLNARNEGPQRARILKMSESKRYVEVRKEIRERQDQKVKDAVQRCIQHLKKSENSQSSGRSRSASPRSFRDLRLHSSDSDSNNDRFSNLVEVEAVQTKCKTSRHNSRNSTPQYIPQCEPQASTSSGRETRGLVHANTSRCQSSSTPRPSRAEDIGTVFADKGTQTDESLFPVTGIRIEELEAGIRHIFNNYEVIFSQTNNNSNVNNEAPNAHNSNTPRTEPVQEVQEAEINEDVQGARGLEDDGNREPVNGSNSKIKEESTRTLRIRKSSAQTTKIPDKNKYIDMVPIGSGHTTVPARLLHDIDWNSHTHATRHLLQAVFPRSVLATHSLTGKQSPAFKDRPAKKILDPQIVDDIVKTVSTKCGVPKNLVRNSITIKCTDEAKLYRNRQQARRPLNQNVENISPLTASSESPQRPLNQNISPLTASSESPQRPLNQNISPLTASSESPRGPLNQNGENISPLTASSESPRGPLNQNGENISPLTASSETPRGPLNQNGENISPLTASSESPHAV